MQQSCRFKFCLSYYMNVLGQIDSSTYYLSLVMRKLAFAYAKTKTQISFTVTAKLISAFVFATRISLYYLNPKFNASRHLQWLHSPVCVGPGRKPRRPVFSQRGSFICAPALAVRCNRVIKSFKSSSFLRVGIFMVICLYH